MYTFYPEGVCSMMIEIELDGDRIGEVVFTGGCNGNLTGISKLIKGMKNQKNKKKQRKIFGSQ